MLLNRDMVSLIGEFAGLSIRMTKRNKFFKNIYTLHGGSSRLIDWVPIYQMNTFTMQQQAKFTHAIQTKQKLLHFMQFCHSNRLPEYLSLLKKDIRRYAKLQTRNGPTIYDYAPVTLLGLSNGMCSCPTTHYTRRIKPWRTLRTAMDPLWVIF